jgi:Mrp family chromosome partitioning ATPase
MVTSALPHEGKTTLSACLAQSAARAGERVIVIDCDSARHRFSTLYGGEKADMPGLREVLGGEVTIAAAIRHNAETGISVLPIVAPFDAGAPLFDSVKMQALLTQLREHFHLILLDSAPVLPIAETRELAAFADRVILVGHWRRTPEKALTAAIELLPPLAQGAIGVVLSMINIKQQARFAEGDAGAFYSSYEAYHHA